MDERTLKDVRILKAIGQDEAARALLAIYGDDEAAGETPTPADPAPEPRTPGVAVDRDEALKMTRAELDQLKQTDPAAYDATMGAWTGRDAAGNRIR